MAQKKSGTQSKGAPRTKKTAVTDASIGSAEDRLGQRVPIQLLVDYKADGSYLFDFCRDLGTGGVFIQTAKPLPTGSDIDLTFTIPDSKETLNAKGTVIWVQAAVTGRKDLVPGMGVQFAEFTNEQRRVLEGFVERYHGGRLVTTSAGNRSDKQAV
jgi:type IV pilus assembly protein PilZ